ncbi:MAG: TonB-dependent receptor [Saprospiraceae bacterium]
MLLRLTLLICCHALVGMGLLTAQMGTISGTVLSDEGRPLEFANVFVQGGRTGTTTDSSGMFNLSALPYGRYELEISLLGFAPYRETIVLDADNPTAVRQISLEESGANLDEIVVSGTLKAVSRIDSPVPVEVYRKEFFRANPTPSVFESLQNINGVRPQLNCSVCNTGDIYINGLEGAYTMVLIDGMPIVSGLATVYGLTGIPQSLIERVEIVKGPASTLYGSEAVGGLINLITKAPGDAPAFSADVFGSNWAELSVDLGTKLSVGEKISALVGVNGFYYDTPIDHNDDGFTDITLAQRVSVFNKWTLARPQGRLFSLAARYNYEDRWGGEMNWTPADRGGEEVYGESITTNRWEVFGNYQLPFNEPLHLQYSLNRHRQDSYYGSTGYLADQLVGFTQLTWNRQLGKNDLLLGAAYRYTSYEDNTPATQDGTDITHLPGFFVQNEIKFDPRNSLLLGLRYDYNSRHGSILTPRLNYKATSTDRRRVLRLSVGNGYRVANVFTEDHAALTGARRVVFVAELAPETSWNGNVNLVQRFYTAGNTAIGLDFSAWYTRFGNRIVADYETDQNLIIYDNLDGHAVSKGVSLNLDLTFTNGLTIIAGGSLMDVTLTEEGNTIRQLLTERATGVWNIGYPIPRTKLTVDYTGNVYGPMRLPLLGEMDGRAEYSPWFSIQNLQLTWKAGREWEIYGGIKNLLDFTPAANSIARAFDPFDRQVTFSPDGGVIPTADNPQALTFDPSYVYASNQGIRAFLGFRYSLK